MAALTFTLDSKKKVLNITNLENADGQEWQWTDHFDAGMGLHSLQFIPGSTGTDVCIIHCDSASGPKMFHVQCADVADQRPLEFYGEDFSNMLLNVTAGTYSTGALLIVTATDRKMGPRR